MGSHGVDHLDLTREPGDARKHQLVQSREEINQRLDAELRAFCVPMGA